MLNIPQIFNKLHRQLTIVLLAGLIWLVSLPTAPVQAAGYYQEQDHGIAVSKPYYGTRERKIVVQTEAIKPYYSTKERKREKVIIKTPAAVDHTIESGKRGQEVIPKD